MSWKTVFYDNFNGGTQGTAPSGWTYDSCNTDEVHTETSLTCGSGACMECYCHERPWDDFTNIYRVVSGTPDPYCHLSFDLKCYGWQQPPSVYGTFAKLGAALRNSSNSVISWIKFEISYVMAGNIYTLNFGSSYIDLSAGIDSVNHFDIYTNQNTGKWWVYVNGTLYDNSGYLFDSDALGNIHNVVFWKDSSAIFTETNDYIGTIWLVDNVKLERYIEDPPLPGYTSGTGFVGWVEPAVDGNNGWRLNRPVCCVSIDTASGMYWSSVGSLASPGLYKALTSGVVTSGTQVVAYSDTDSEVWNSCLDAYYYYGLSSAAADQGRLPVKWTNDVPYVGSISMLDTAGNVVTNGYSRKSGFIKINDMRGYTSGLTTGAAGLNQYHFGIEYIDLYSGGEVFATINTVSGCPQTATMPSGTVTYHNRLSETTRVVPFEFYKYDGTNPSWLDHMYWSVTIPYNDEDIEFNADCLFAVIYSESGSLAKTASLYFEKPGGYPIVDRLAVYANQSSGVYDYRILGHVDRTIPVSRIEYTKDRRIPIISIPVSGGVLETSDGEMPYSYKVPSMYIVEGP